MFIHLTCMLPSWNAGSLPKAYYTLMREKMENKERAQIKTHYQKKIKSIKGEVARLTNILERLLSFKNGKGTSA